MGLFGQPAACAQGTSTLRPALRALAQLGATKSYRKHSIIVHEDDEGDSLFILLEGRVKLFSADRNDREVIYSTIGAGDYFGELSLDGARRSASVMALEPCLCSVVTRAEVRKHFVEYPPFAFDLVTQIIRRARAAHENTRRMALQDVYSRVVHVLESHSGAARPDAPVLLTQITHQQIAACVGASREMVSRLLKDLETGGYVELGVKRITLRRKLPARW